MSIQKLNRLYFARTNTSMNFRIGLSLSEHCLYLRGKKYLNTFKYQ